MKFQTPLLFSNHDIVIECAAVQQPSTVIFTSLDSRVYVCGTYNGEAKQQLARWQPHVEGPTREGLRQRLRTDTEGSNSGAAIMASQQVSGNAPVALLQPESGSNRAQVWAIDVRNHQIALGCSDGTVEVGTTARVLGRYGGEGGVVQVKLRSNKLIIGRLNGSLELVGLQFTDKVSSSHRE